jgi:acetyl-CoA carboxylase biotin carboxyl carrier protein
MTDDTRGRKGGMQVDTDLVRQLADLLNDTKLNEIEVEDGGRKIRLVRHMDFTGMGMVGNLAPSARTGFVSEPAQPAPAPTATPAAEVSPANHPGAVKSPMVGTVYLSGEPGAKPFVSPGDSVREGETLLIVEAMKVMNPIAAPRAGTVRQVLVVDGQPVEFDQPLVIVE